MSGAWRPAGVGVTLANEEVREARRNDVTRGHDGKVTQGDGIISETWTDKQTSMGEEKSANSIWTGEGRVLTDKLPMSKVKMPVDSI